MARILTTATHFAFFNISVGLCILTVLHLQNEEAGQAVIDTVVEDEDVQWWGCRFYSWY